MIRIGIILGSVRPNRKGEQVARWVQEAARRHDDVEVALIDLRDHPLPHLDEPLPAMFGRYEYEHTKAWSATIEPFDAYVFVTPEYNHGMPGVLKNAIDHLFAEWANKAAGIVSYGVNGGVSAAAQLRLTCALLRMAVVSHEVTVSVLDDFPDDVLTPSKRSTDALAVLLDQVVSWSTALAPLRTPTTV